MKLSNKIVALLLALSLLTALAACGSNPPEDVTPSDEIGDISSTHVPEETPEATENRRSARLRSRLLNLLPSPPRRLSNRLSRLSSRRSSLLPPSLL